MKYWEFIRDCHDHLILSSISPSSWPRRKEPSKQCWRDRRRWRRRGKPPKMPKGNSWNSSEMHRLLSVSFVFYDVSPKVKGEIHLGVYLQISELSSYQDESDNIRLFLWKEFFRRFRSLQRYFKQRALAFVRSWVQTLARQNKISSFSVQQKARVFPSEMASKLWGKACKMSFNSNWQPPHTNEFVGCFALWNNCPSSLKNWHFTSAFLTQTILERRRGGNAEREGREIDWKAKMEKRNLIEMRRRNLRQLRFVKMTFVANRRP